MNRNVVCGSVPTADPAAGPLTAPITCDCSIALPFYDSAAISASSERSRGADMGVPLTCAPSLHLGLSYAISLQVSPSDVLLCQSGRPLCATIFGVPTPKYLWSTHQGHALGGVGYLYSCSYYHITLAPQPPYIMSPHRTVLKTLSALVF